MKEIRFCLSQIKGTAIPGFGARSKRYLSEEQVTTGRVRLTSVLNSEFLCLSAPAHLAQSLPDPRGKEQGQCLTDEPSSVGTYPAPRSIPNLILWPRFFGLIGATKHKSAEGNSSKCHVSLSGRPSSVPLGFFEGDPAWGEDAEATLCPTQASAATSAVGFFCPFARPMAGSFLL